MEWSISLLRHFKIQTLLKINCCMATISAFRVTQHSQIFSLFFRNRIQCIALYQLYDSQALLDLRRGYYSFRARVAFENTLHRIITVRGLWPAATYNQKTADLTKYWIDSMVYITVTSIIKIWHKTLVLDFFFRRIIKIRQNVDQKYPNLQVKTPFLVWKFNA